MNPQYLALGSCTEKKALDRVGTFAKRFEAPIILEESHVRDMKIGRVNGRCEVRRM